MITEVNEIGVGSEGVHGLHILCEGESGGETGTGTSSKTSAQITGTRFTEMARMHAHMAWVTYLEIHGLVITRGEVHITCERQSGT